MLSFFSKTFSEIRWVYEFYMLLDWHGSKNVSSLVRPAGLRKSYYAVGPPALGFELYETSPEA